MAGDDGITHQISVWVQNDYDYYDEAVEKAREGWEAFREWAVDILMSAPADSVARGTVSGILWSWPNWREVASDLIEGLDEDDTDPYEHEPLSERPVRD